MLMRKFELKAATIVWAELNMEGRDGTPCPTSPAIMELDKHSGTGKKNFVNYEAKLGTLK